MVVQTVGVEFFCYHRDRPDSLALREELQEQHWSYMDRYQAEMIARGPTLAADGDTPTGSVHIVDLPDPAAARAFAFDEPNYQAGVYRDVLLRRWRNLLGRTMWDFPGGPDSGNRYLVLGLGAGPAADLTVAPGRAELIAHGPLQSDDGASWLGTAVLVRAPDQDTARAILTQDRYAGIEVHQWQFGGRRLCLGIAHLRPVKMTSLGTWCRDGGLARRYPCASAAWSPVRPGRRQCVCPTTRPASPPARLRISWQGPQFLR
jgi:uncharacterized protein